MNCSCFYVLPDGKVFDNPKVWPADILGEFHSVSPRSIFRFAFVPSENKVYIQDPSFRALLTQGLETPWNFFNQALKALEAKFNVRGPAVAFGDPADSVVERSLSEYKHATARLRQFFKEDVGMELPEIVVREIPGQSESADKGLLVIGRTFSNDDDPSYLTINKVVEHALLKNIDTVFASDQKLVERLTIFRQGRPDQAFFAVLDNDKVRVFKAKVKADGTLPEERDIRSATPTYQGPVVMFSFDPMIPSINFRNEIPNYLRSSKEGKAFVDEVVAKIAKLKNIMPIDMVVTFDASLGRPFVTSSSRYGFGAFGQEKIYVLEMPFVDHIAIVIKDPDDEEVKAPGLKMKRAVHGIEVKYPFILMNDRLTTRGLALRALTRSLHDINPQDPTRPPPSRDFISFLILKGIPKEDVIDFVAGRDDLVMRNRISKMVDALVEKQASSRKRIVLAGWGKGLGINDWWSLNIPQALNAISLNPKAKPFNLKKNPQAKQPKTYEAMLSEKHDEQAPYRLVDTQLRHSQI